ncbi:hypothetical protein AVEN_116108-1 [Araneus ventricosus]|uniref:Uncharacterized protein n=1 Tax=Araneus ventricosus TaxID=182803 RepID=A0A4Y2V9C5_ARAVE|nr:hypothetical protein AVEN_116108-1 [Araneus ventricosus]
MQVSSGTKNNPPPNEPSRYTTVTVSFNGVLLVVTLPGALHMKVRRIRLQNKPGLVGKHHTKTTVEYHNACSLLQANRRRQYDGKIIPSPIPSFNFVWCRRKEKYCFHAQIPLQRDLPIDNKPSIQ